MFPMSLEKVTPFHNNGVLYFHKRDLSFRPVLILNIERLCNQWRYENVDVVCKFVNYLINFGTEELMIPGRVESMITLIDLRNVGVTQVPV